MTHPLKGWFSKKKQAEAYPWSLFKELEDSLNLIEDFGQISFNFIGKIREILPVRRQALYVYDQDLGRFKDAASFGLDEPALKSISFSRHDPLLKWLKVNKTYLYVKNQPGVLNSLSPKEKDVLRFLGAEVCYPLISMNRLIGILFLGSKETGSEYSKRDLALISSLTPQAGIALENALLYREQRERFRRMLRADKLATIGELAAGAAHEIRNPLTAIKSSLQYLEAKSRDKPASKLLATALEETGRIENILSGLLSFSRPTELKKERHDLLETLEEGLDLISFQALKKQVRIIRVFPQAPLELCGDRAQLKQLFLNLFINALQAMKEGGELKVEVTPADAQKALVAVSDTGEGIAERNLDRIFEPFFTTKKGGTGLGLSICYGIVKSHRGDIEFKSRINLGTTALVKLPLNL